MSVSVFLDTLRKHELDQFYPTFSTHGITHLQSLAELSLQDYSRLGITDTGDRRKIFGLVQAIRKDTEFNRTTNTTTTTMMNSGLRQPQSYATSTNNSRLPLPDTMPSSNGNNRGRRQSVISTLKPSNTPPHHVRNRTMSDAPRPDFQQQQQQQQQQRAPFKDRRLELRRSLYLDQLQHQQQQQESESDSENESTTKNRKYRASAPLLDAYGVPLSPAKQARALSSFQNASASTTSRHIEYQQLPPSDLNQKIRVCVRKRPLSKKEVDKGDKDMAPATGNRGLQINEPKLRLDLSRYTEQHAFIFDDVFDLNCPNTTVYERTALPLVDYIFQGGKATCFAYGQTGSGKTFTMLDPKQGLYIMAARDIFSLLRKPENDHLSAWIGLYEIYQGQLYDLLNGRKKLFAREDGKNNVIISGLKEYPIDNVDKLIQVFDYGSSVRSTGSTGANDSSSRSHAVLQILLKHKKNRKKIHGKLSFIDLAGSERGADRGEADTKTRMEGAEINKSLLALKECIRALDQDKSHTPFRQSKLTQVLKDSFVGNSRTCMIATISPGGSNSEHTLNTLRYADRVKELKGERDRKSTMERNPSASGIVQDQTNMNTKWPDPSHYEEAYDDDDDDDDDDDLNYSNDDYYSNESDILDDDTFNVDGEDLFDVDFPHEQDDDLIHPNFNTQKLPSSPPLYNGGMVSVPSQQQTYNHGSSYHQQQRPNSMSPTFTDTTANGMTRHFSLQMKPSSSTLPRSISMYAPSTRSSLDDTNYSTPQQRITVDTSITYQPQPQLQQTPTSSISGIPSFSFDKMDEFVKFHRAEIREITDCTKKETKLVANISLDLSSNFDDQQQQNDHKSQSQFVKYLRDLDEILDRKLAAVEALRDRINDTVSQVEL